jgi:hypothetical protein
MFIDKINDLQEAAIGSAGLLAELAGLETYIAETYTQRCLTELLQNSDDAGSTKVHIFQLNNDLVYLNNGKAFDDADFVSLCSSALSSKQRGESIGYRGIGFKSVVNICDSVIVASGEIRCAFDRQRTRALLKTELKVPLIRVPHLLTTEEETLSRDILNENLDFSTCFIFRGIEHDLLNEELRALTNEHFLFLRNLLSIDIKVSDVGHSLALAITRSDLTGVLSGELLASQVMLSSITSGISSSWIVLSKSETAIAFISENNIPARLPGETALLHAYLPTQCLSGTGVRLNSDFSTDPSRTRLKYDQLTDSSIGHVSELFYCLLKAYVGDPASLFLLAAIDALVPYSNYKMHELQGNNFCGLLLQKLSCLLSASPLRMCAIPSVFKDIEHLSSSLPCELCVFVPVSSSFSEAKRFLGSVGILPLPTSEILIHYGSEANSIDPRCSPILIRNLLNERVPVANIASLYIFPSLDANVLQFSDFASALAQLDPAFVSDLSEKLMSSIRAKEFLLEAGLPESATVLFFPKVTNPIVLNAIASSQGMKEVQQVNALDVLSDVQTRFLDDAEKRRYGIKDWRLAEELVAFHYRSKGYHVIDVSKANKGYDLEVSSDTGRLCVEIKKLGSPPSDFTLTQNEFNESIFRGESFVLALVSARHEGKVEIMFISNPYQALSAFTTKRAKAYEFYVSGFAYVPTVAYE